MKPESRLGRYVLVTPARNEADFLVRTLESVIAQTVRPVRWVIVDDGSTDRTPDLVRQFLGEHEFIRLIQVERGGERNFGRKALAFAEGYAQVREIDFDFIGNLDADISLAPDYYERILSNFATDQNLGISGGIVYTKIGNDFATSDETEDSVGGAVQLFRRACFEAVGGYPVLRWGGIDAAAEITAKMLGWRVQKFSSIKVFEHRRTGTAEAAPLRARIREGRRFHSLGYGHLFYFVRCLYRIKDRPFLIGSLAAYLGYLDSLVRRRPILLSCDVVRYLRTEQRARLRAIAFSWLSQEPDVPPQQRTS